MGLTSAARTMDWALIPFFFFLGGKEAFPPFVPPLFRRGEIPFINADKIRATGRACLVAAMGLRAKKTGWRVLFARGIRNRERVNPPSFCPFPPVRYFD